MGRLTVLPNDEEMVLTDLSQEKMSDPKTIFPIVKKRVRSFLQSYGRFGRPRKMYFLNWPFLGPFAISPT